MKTLKMLQKVFLIVALLVLVYGILAALTVVPAKVLTPAGLQRFANTCVLFSIGLGLIIIVDKKG